MTDDYVELFLKWAAGAEAPQVKTWLEKNGLSTVRMKHGLLITGGLQQVEAVFGVSLRNKQPPVELPIPQEFAAHVAAITLPRPRSYHG